MSVVVPKLMRETDLLLVIDVQRDFCHGGRLAVPDGDAVVPVICDLATYFRDIVLTQDWHPSGHSSFASVHAGKEPFDRILLDYGPQTLWPDHCVQNTPGAEFHPGLAELTGRSEMMLRKGFRREIDSYSAFVENDKKTPTGLAGYLCERGFRRIFLAGLAYDYCVRFSAVDAVEAGFETWVVFDACRSVGGRRADEETFRELEQSGVRQVSSSEFRHGGIE